jgi:hypothetical protein
MRYTLLSLALLLMGCVESEESCYNRLSNGLSNKAIANGVGVELSLIFINKDLNVCSFTVLGGAVVRR